MIVDIEPVHAWVPPQFLGLDEPTECYIFAVTSIPSRPLLFTCHLQNGAIFSRLPIWAFRHTRDIKEPCQLSRRLLNPWGALGRKISCIQHSYLKDYELTYTKSNFSGRYLMTFDFLDGYLSEDPGQHKTLTMIELRNGQFALWPNNHFKALDKHFTADVDLKIKRNTQYFTSD